MLKQRTAGTSAKLYFPFVFLHQTPGQQSQTAHFVTLKAPQQFYFISSMVEAKLVKRDPDKAIEVQFNHVLWRKVV